MENMKKIAIVILLIIAAAFVYKKMNHHESNVKIQKQCQGAGCMLGIA